MAAWRQTLLSLLPFRVDTLQTAIGNQHHKNTFPVFQNLLSVTDFHGFMDLNELKLHEQHCMMFLIQVWPKIRGEVTFRCHFVIEKGK